MLTSRFGAGLTRNVFAVVAGIMLLAIPPAAANADDGATPMTIIVIGSSSAAGKNIYKLFKAPKSEESAYAKKYNWVALYREYVKAIDPRNEVLNLATPGYSTSMALHDEKGSATYMNSLAYVIATRPDADALILNFPAIRNGEGESVAAVIDNLKEIERRAVEAGVKKVWVATAQPYSNKVECLKRSRLCPPELTIFRSRIDLSTAIRRAFPDAYIDFYTPLADGEDPAGVAAKTLLNAKDDLHPNLKGHEALCDAVIDAGVYRAAGAN